MSDEVREGQVWIELAPVHREGKARNGSTVVGRRVVRHLWIRLAAPSITVYARYDSDAGARSHRILSAVIRPPRFMLAHGPIPPAGFAPRRRLPATGETFKPVPVVDMTGIKRPPIVATVQRVELVPGRGPNSRNRWMAHVSINRGGLVKLKRIDVATLRREWTPMEESA